MRRKNFDKKIAKIKARIEALEKETRKLRVEIRRLEREKKLGSLNIVDKYRKMPFKGEFSPLGKWSAREKEHVRNLIQKYRQELVEIHHFEVAPVCEVRFGYATTEWGSCGFVDVVEVRHSQYEKHNEVIITISRYTYLEGEEFLKNTILHELCHAIKQCRGECHGPNWKLYASKISALYDTDIQRADSADKTKALLKKTFKWKVSCESCHATWYYRVATKFVVAVAKNHAEGWTCCCGAKGQFMLERVRGDE